MNNDLISRRSAIDSIKKCLEVAHDNWEFGEERAYVNAIECLEEEPPIQPQQKTGRWITRFDGSLHYCSECGWALMDTESGVPPYMGTDYHRSNEERWTCCPGWNEWLMNFCPNCGSYNGGKENG